MKLFYSPQSPYARKVRAAAVELGLTDALELEVAKVVPGTPNREYARTANPLRKIPALAADDGTVLYDSAVICEYLDDRAGGGRLFPREPARRWPVLRDHALAQGITDALILLRYETWLRPEAYRWPDWIDDQWDKANAGLDAFETRADELPGEPDIARLALGCALGYLDLRWPDTDWRTSRPKLAAWFDGELALRPSFTETAPPAA